MSERSAKAASARRRTRFPRGAVLVVVCGAGASWACGDSSLPRSEEGAVAEPSPTFRNVGTGTAYVGDAACTDCHVEVAASYGANAMSRSLHYWSADARMESIPREPVVQAVTGLHYGVVDEDGSLYQEEYIPGPGGRRLHELRRRMDVVMGSGNVARSYFTEENGRLFQLPLTWYRERGWDFSPGYELNNPRFGRVMPDGCVACHGSYPEPIPFVEGKYAELRPGIGCERCHGPGALHVEERSADPAPAGSYDDTIVDPARLPVERRLDVCEQCHVHTPVSVLREGEGAFDYVPSRPLSDHVAFFRATGSIDIVSHADRLRQSACFLATRPTPSPLECSTCHAPHGPESEAGGPNGPCLACHSTADLDRRLASSSARADHGEAAPCVRCHMPPARERGVPHGTFTDHWIRVVRGAEPRPGRPADGALLEPYFERDRSGPEAATYQAMARIVYASQEGDLRVLADAAASLEQALAGDTTRGDALFLLGVAWGQVGRTDEAARALEAASRADPEDPRRLHALARIHEASGRDPAVTEGLYRRAVELQPVLPWIHADFADFLEAQGRAAEAEAEYRAAVAEQPSLAVAWFDLGALLTAAGRDGEAGFAFSEAVRLDPSLAEALAPLHEVRSAGEELVTVRPLRPLLGTLPVRDRGPNAVRITIDPAADGLVFQNLPPGVSVRILEPDGTPVRSLGVDEPGRDRWDLRTATGRLVSGGLLHGELRQSLPDGGTRRLVLPFGVVRQRRP